ncbi:MULTISPECIES: nucleoside diphosphate kinase regulator [Chelatococcus]|uniref:Regulator of nucleoside diphosphate kinase n=1 Tax=Chelatococcus caeni TaxID=1348468 RepID=A0A840C734_9HYPH|nr:MULTISPECIES: nucleoside diphosphate kinase regulator [Chelatococcus]ALA17594.1 nucleoside diphosphate kinase [Chelatococcus sp. CO-6]MBB4019229.1 regulator of nucleoside diphosphate kinase [Chelatococcus caeni]
MSTVSSRRTLRRPPITVSQEDFDRLYALAEAAADRQPEVAENLLGELDRAKVLPAGKLRSAVVAMGSRVTFEDEVTGKVQTVELVYPGEADIAAGRISILTPIGVALIGLAAGQSISWETRGGERRQLKVHAVEERS